MDDEWEELQSPWQIDGAVHLHDHFPIINHTRRSDATSVPPPPGNLEEPPASPPSSSASSSPTPPPGSPPAEAASSSARERRPVPRAAAAREAAARLRLRLWVACAELRRTASKAVAAWRFWTVAATTGAAAAFLLHLLYRRLSSRWRRRPAALRDDNRDRLAVLLKEKEEKISRLLVRIAEMNEALTARRRVPVIRVG